MDWWVEDAEAIRRKNMNEPRGDPTTVVCGNQVFIFGGCDLEQYYLESLSMLHLETGGCSSGPCMSSARRECTVIKFDEIWMILIGVQAGNEILSSLEIWYTDTYIFARNKNLLELCYSQVAANINYDQVIILGDTGFMFCIMGRKRNTYKIWNSWIYQRLSSIMGMKRNTCTYQNSWIYQR